MWKRRHDNLGDTSGTGKYLNPTASVFLNRALIASMVLPDINLFFLNRTASIRETGIRSGVAFSHIVHSSGL